MDNFKECSHFNHDKLYSTNFDIQTFFILFYQSKIINKNIENEQQLLDAINEINNLNSKHFQLLWFEDYVTKGDPFMFEHKEKLYLFFERINKNPTNNRYIHGIGEICCCELKYENGKYYYTKPHVIIQKSFHLSYPQVFELNGKIYMMPEQSKSKKLMLYESIEFPYKWNESKTLLEGKFVDSTLVYHNNIYWIFTTCKLDDNYIEQRIYYASDIFGEWKEFLLWDKPKTKKVLKGKYIRCGGNIIKINN